jgi:hypothetical protein
MIVNDASPGQLSFEQPHYRYLLAAAVTAHRLFPTSQTL